MRLEFPLLCQTVLGGVKPPPQPKNHSLSLGHSIGIQQNLAAQTVWRQRAKGTECSLEHPKLRSIIPEVFSSLNNSGIARASRALGEHRDWAALQDVPTALPSLPSLCAHPLEQERAVIIQAITREWSLWSRACVQVMKCQQQ